MGELDSTPSAPVAVGEILASKYRVDRVLGIGGMGVVIAATHLQLDQKVAIKFMLPGGLGNASLVERFAREARAAVRLKSDHVARVLDVGVLDSGSPYMVMEFLEGSDLGEFVEQHGAMPIETAVDCVLQACDAVAEAHSLGIVHRDLKPRNLFWTRRNDGRPLVKVLDFGISKHKATADLSLTRTTEIIGSPNYMSPEQFRSARAADERSDIWSLGVILYELLTGHVPFQADTITQLTAMVLSDPPQPIGATRADVPEDLQRAIACCLQKDPAARFPTVAAFAAALQSHASADTRDLAFRIARISSGGRAVQAGSPFSDSNAAGGTTAGWTARTEAPGGKRRSAALTLGIAGGLAALGAAGWVALAHLSPGGRGAVAPSSTSPADSRANGARAVTAEANGRPGEGKADGNQASPGAIPSVASAGSVGLAPVLAAPSAGSLTDLAPSARAVTVSAPPLVHGAPPGATAAAPLHPGKDPVRPRNDAPAATAPAATTPAGEEPPRYRTTW